MSGTERIATRDAEIGGGLLIRRALPALGRRTVGAWCFLDHAGPLEIRGGAGLRVGPHPHIGLQTFTWMIEGAVMHRDSLGNRQLITPGQVNLMTAGCGISHSEDSAGDEPGVPHYDRLHAVQLWIALPDAERHRPPAFKNYPRLPRFDSGGFAVTVLAGTLAGHSAPARVYSPLVGADLVAEGPASAVLPLETGFEHAALVLTGTAQVAGESLTPGTLLYLPPGRAALDVRCESAARLVVIGGEPFTEPLLLWWNFVARSVEELEQASRDWNTGTRFGTVTGSPSPPLVPPTLDGLKLRSTNR